MNYTLVLRISPSVIYITKFYYKISKTSSQFSLPVPSIDLFSLLTMYIHSQGMDNIEMVYTKQFHLQAKFTVVTFKNFVS